MGSQNDLKSLKMMSWGHLCTRVAPKWLPGTLRNRFWRASATILGTFSPDFWTTVPGCSCFFRLWVLAVFCKTRCFIQSRSWYRNLAVLSKACRFIQCLPVYPRPATTRVAPKSLPKSKHYCVWILTTSKSHMWLAFGHYLNTILQSLCGDSGSTYCWPEGGRRQWA